MTQREKGFTLVEVMVAVVVIAVGLLGIASLQTASLGTTTTARVNSLVAIEANSLAQAMEANTGYWHAGIFPINVFTVNGSTISDSVLSSSYKDCETNGCSATELAAYDLEQWGANLKSVVPGATGSINCATGTNGMADSCTISIIWTDKQSAAVNSGAKRAAAAQNTYQITVAV